jgi:hypothetical protein
MIIALNSIDVADLLVQYYQLENEIQWTSSGHKGRQAGLQFKDGEDPWTSANGRSRGQELSYGNLNTFFKNTAFEKIIIDYNLKRTRLMWSNPMSCYSMHKDSTPRIHIPLITHPECYFVFKQGIIQHMPVGQVYWVNTVEPHTFINCSEVPRLHIVGVVNA